MLSEVGDYWISASPAVRMRRCCPCDRRMSRPRWLSTPKGPAPINARAETLGERPLFRGALASGRCLIPADGYYEWVQEQGRRGKQPYWLHLPDRSVFGFAGIWTTGPDDVATCAIVTTAAHPRVARLHPRMPVILSADCEGLWLDAELRDPLAASACLTADMGAHLEALPVSPLVSSVRNDGPQLLLPLT